MRREQTGDAQKLIWDVEEDQQAAAFEVTPQRLLRVAPCSDAQVVCSDGWTSQRDVQRIWEEWREEDQALLGSLERP